MNDELKQFDADLKGYFVENNIEEMLNMLNDQSNEPVKEVLDENWTIIMKYYDSQNYELIFRHIKFVAYTCFLVEYAHQRGLLEDTEFEAKMMVYHDIYEKKQQ